MSFPNFDFKILSNTKPGHPKTCNARANEKATKITNKIVSPTTCSAFAISENIIIPYCTFLYLHLLLSRKLLWTISLEVPTCIPFLVVDLCTMFRQWTNPIGLLLSLRWITHLYPIHYLSQLFWSWKNYSQKKPQLSDTWPLERMRRLRALVPGQLTQWAPA